MAQITSGSVCIEDGLKKNEEYAPPRKVSVTLNFGVVEGEDFQEVFDLASQAASNRVHSLLHGTPIRAVVNDPQAPAAVNDPQAPAAEGTPARKHRRTAAEIAADNALALAAHPKGDPAAVEDFDIGDGDGGSDGSKDPASVDDFSIEPDEEVGDIEVITDAALNAAVQRKNADLGDPELIRGVIKSYNPDPTKAFQLREIPQDKRAEFLTKLGALTKAG